MSECMEVACAIAERLNKTGLPKTMDEARQIVKAELLDEGEQLKDNVAEFLFRYSKRMREGGENVKSTGIIRRIDDLGRVVIPKGVRHEMRIRTSDPLEIIPTDDGILLKRYDSTKTIADVLQELIELVGEAEELGERAELLFKINEIAAAIKAEQNERKD